ncbi:MAG TPA: hypothetical protein VLG68_08760 [Gammaproteobacteria bacterium]|nr:hypothetical protein [Gammaproteobacteria bacterium]
MARFREYGSALTAPPPGSASARLGAAFALPLFVFLLPAARADDCPLPPAGAVQRWQGEAAWTTLADQAYRIGKVHILVDNVFDLDNPDEDTWYGRTADALHVETHPGVIRDQLLFKSGDAVDPRLMYESVRLLRSLSFLRYADITPESCQGQTVDVTAHVKDAWTLKFDLNFTHVGGQSNLGASFKDVDFLGTGKTLALGHKSDQQRSTNQVSYQDPELLGSRWQLGATYAHLSDGHIHEFDLNQPFYEDYTPWSFTFHYLDQLQNLNFYEKDTLAWSVPDRLRSTELDWMWLMGFADGSGTRLGVSYLYQDYGYGALESFPPVFIPQPDLRPRRLGGPAFDWEYFEDHYASFTNLALIGRTEDYNMGWDTRAQAGYLGTTFGSDIPGAFYDVSTSYGGLYGDRTVLVSNASLQGRRQSGKDRNVLGSLVFTLYNNYFDDHTLVFHGDVEYTLRPDPENMLYLGGLQGMPGYPNYFYIGDRRWQSQVADRWVTPYRLWNIFQVGFSAYVDVGQIRRLGDSWSPTLADAGLALRLGDVRSAYGGVIYITYAWPLVNVPGVSGKQFVIGNIFTF